tara:strand:+ start:356 stop:502 length:147 start_codon:yes stop_codon:yes gene_type:complete
MKKNLPDYFIKLVKMYPNILNGRKNQINQNKRIIKNLNLTKKYKKNKF